VKAQDARGANRGIIFPLSKLKLNGGKSQLSWFFLAYYLEQKPGLEEVETFDQMVSSFRFIKK
jgi:hypothetical protein